MNKIVPFQLRLMEDINREIKVDAAKKSLTKHEWIERAIQEKLERERTAVQWMARPRKEGMDYFPHDANAVNDKKIEALRMLYGNDGYAFYFILLEIIYQEPTFELDVSDAETRQILARKVAVTDQKFENMLETSIKRECFDSQSYHDRHVLTSNGIKKRANVVSDKRIKMQEYHAQQGKKVSGDVSDAETGEETPQSKGKESKSKSKALDKDYTPAFESFWSIYPRKIGKQEAFGKWKTALKTHDADFIIQCATNYAKDCESKNTSSEYIKHARTFLEKERYTDYQFLVIGGGNDGKYRTGYEGNRPSGNQKESYLERQPVESLYFGSPQKI